LLRFILTETSSLRFSSVISEISDKSTDSSENEADVAFTFLFEIWTKKNRVENEITETESENCNAKWRRNEWED